jgi:hypothetical protein
LIDRIWIGEASPQNVDLVELAIAIAIGVIGDSFDYDRMFQPESDFDPDFGFGLGRADRAALRHRYFCAVIFSSRVVHGSATARNRGRPA